MCPTWRQVGHMNMISLAEYARTHLLSFLYKVFMSDIRVFGIFVE
jgi:hypothetical protein